MSKILTRCIAVVVLTTFFGSTVVTPRAFAATPLLGLPEPGTMVNLSAAFKPVMVKGLTVHPENPLMFDFIVSGGDTGLEGQALKDESQKLIKYFLACLTVPEKNWWVNLSPYEKDKIVPQDLGQTDLGRDMLAQDYVLKQITASLIYPEKKIGKDFWDRVYQKAQAQFGSTEIPVNTFNKVWVLADKAEVLERNNTAFVVGAHLKVMLDSDYLAMQKNSATTRGLVENLSPSRLPSDVALNVKAPQVNPVSTNVASQIIREIVLPELEKEVNAGQNFAQLRQIYHALILANWYKTRLKDALLNQVYANQGKVNGIDLADKTVKDKIYERYLTAYKKGVFNYIKEEASTPRKYFSGGLQQGVAAVKPVVRTNPLPSDVAQLSSDLNLSKVNFALANPDLAQVSDAAMTTIMLPPAAKIDRGLTEALAVYAGAVYGVNPTGVQRLTNFIFDVNGKEEPRDILSLLRPDATGKAPVSFDKPEYKNVPYYSATALFSIWVGENYSFDFIPQEDQEHIDEEKIVFRFLAGLDNDENVVVEKLAHWRERHGYSVEEALGIIQWAKRQLQEIKNILSLENKPVLPSASTSTTSTGKIQLLKSALIEVKSTLNLSQNEEELATVLVNAVNVPQFIESLATLFAIPPDIKPAVIKEGVVVEQAKVVKTSAEKVANEFKNVGILNVDKLSTEVILNAQDKMLLLIPRLRALKAASLKNTDSKTVLDVINRPNLEKVMLQHLNKTSFINSLRGFNPSIIDYFYNLSDSNTFSILFDKNERPVVTVTTDDFSRVVMDRQQGKLGVDKNVETRALIPPSQDIINQRVLEWANLTESERVRLIAKEVDMFQKGLVAAIIMAGGEATRYGGPKAFKEVTPELGEFLGIKADNLRWFINTFGKEVPLFLLSSETRIESFKQQLAQRNFYGLKESLFKWYVQGSVDTFIPTDAEIDTLSVGAELKEKFKKAAALLRQENPDGIYRFQGKKRPVVPGHLDAVSAFIISGRLTDALEAGIEYLPVFNIDNLKAILKNQGLYAQFAESGADFGFILAEKNIVFEFENLIDSAKKIPKVFVRFKENVISLDDVEVFQGEVTKDGYRFVINTFSKTVDVIDVLSGEVVGKVIKKKPETGGTLVQYGDSGEVTMKEGFELPASFPHELAPFFNSNTVLIRAKSLLRILGLPENEEGISKLKNMSFDERSSLVREKIVKQVRANFELKEHAVEGDFNEYGKVEENKLTGRKETKINVSQITRIMLQVAQLSDVKVQYYFMPRFGDFAPVKTPDDAIGAARNSADDLKKYTLKNSDKAMATKLKIPASSITQPVVTSIPQRKPGMTLMRLREKEKYKLIKIAPPIINRQGIDSKIKKVDQAMTAIGNNVINEPVDSLRNIAFSLIQEQREAKRDEALYFELDQPDTEGRYLGALRKFVSAKIVGLEKEIIDAGKLDADDLANAKDSMSLPDYVAELQTMADQAMRGGIDFNPANLGMTVTQENGGVKMTIDPAEIERMKKQGVSGFTPVIINIVPIANIFPLLGLEAPSRRDNEQLAGV